MSFGVVGHAEFINEVNAKDVAIQVLAGHVRYKGGLAFVGEQQGVDPIELDVIVSCSGNVGLVVFAYGIGKVPLKGVQGQASSSRPHALRHGDLVSINIDGYVISKVMSRREEGRPSF